VRSLRNLGLALAHHVSAAGCTQESPQATAAGRAAHTFADALSSSPSRACALLAPQTREELEQSSGSCDQAIAAAGVPRAGTVLDVQVYGLDAIVALQHDTMFLAHFDSGWRVTAAGCTPQEKDRPYSCQIKGG
jgi:hypothetical protein